MTDNIFNPDLIKAINNLQKSLANSSKIINQPTLQSIQYLANSSNMLFKNISIDDMQKLHKSIQRFFKLSYISMQNRKSSTYPKLAFSIRSSLLEIAKKTDFSQLISKTDEFWQKSNSQAPVFNEDGSIALNNHVVIPQKEVYAITDKLIADKVVVNNRNDLADSFQTENSNNIIYLLLLEFWEIILSLLNELSDNEEIT